MTYTFNITLRPYGDSPDTGVVGIDPAARYGYWERRDGSEGGGLWFTRDNNNLELELTDYDGDYTLPRKVIAALRAHGVLVSPDFE
jgi:hypothetical protein